MNRKIVAKNFKKSPNVVTLLPSLSQPSKVGTSPNSLSVLPTQAQIILLSLHLAPYEGSVS